MAFAQKELHWFLVEIFHVWLPNRTLNPQKSRREADRTGFGFFC